MHPTGDAANDLTQRLGERLQAWTGNRWAVIVSNAEGEPTIAEVRDATATALQQEATAHPLVQAVLATFPKARITDIRTEADRAQEAESDALAEVEDEWDPFDDG